MNGDYGALRLWSTVLMFIGILGVIFVIIGVIFAVLGATSYWQVFTILLIGGPLAALFASWPIDQIAPKRSRYTAKTLRICGAEPSIKTRRGAWRSFSTGW